MLSEDVRNLKKGLEELKSEKEKEPDNFVIFISFHTCNLQEKTVCIGCILLIQKCRHECLIAC